MSQRMNAQSLTKGKKHALATAVALLVAAQGLQAMEFDTGNPDLTVRLDTQLRYNLGVRVGEPTDTFRNEFRVDSVERAFDKGDVVMNRLDALFELDTVYKGDHGFRLSAAAWRDMAYDGNLNTMGTPPQMGEYANNQSNAYYNKYVRGPGYELLDAFVFTNFNVGGVGVGVKAGKHNLYWGESMFTQTNGVAYGQGALDGIKGASSPGVEAKELFMPHEQISATFQLNDELTLAAQYSLDWESVRQPAGGTYFATADQPRSDFSFHAPVPNRPDVEPADKKGNWGVSARWTPEALAGGSLGVYYRKFDEKLPWSFLLLNGRTPLGVGFSYNQDVELLGVSYAHTWKGASMGWELSTRRNTGLRSANSFATQSMATYEDVAGARGNTLHGLVNAVKLLPHSSLWDGASFAGELSFVHLLDVTNDPKKRYVGDAANTTYNCVGADPAKPAMDICPSKTAFSMNIAFTPNWAQVLPGVNMTLPIKLGYGLRGTGATTGSQIEGNTTFSIGVGATYLGKHNFNIQYAKTIMPYSLNANGSLNTSDPRLTAGAVQNTHDWISFSYKTNF